MLNLSIFRFGKKYGLSVQFDVKRYTCYNSVIIMILT